MMISCRSQKESEERIAVLMTCYNRKEITLACLASLFSQEVPGNVKLAVYLVDDASSDGTADAVKRQFPAVNIICGNGALYWCGGMRLAWQQVLGKRYSRYLWLNDDTSLVPEAISVMLRVDVEGRRIVVGSCRDPLTGAHTYGGRVRRSDHIRLPSEPILPADVPVPCDTMNGNIVLVPQSVVEKIGILSSVYSHLRGDVDYGLRAQSAGIPILVAPGYMGKCTRHQRITPWADPDVPVLERLRKMCEPKGIPPREWYVYVRRHTGRQWPLYFIKPFIRVMVPALWSATS